MIKLSQGTVSTAVLCLCPWKSLSCRSLQPGSVTRSQFENYSAGTTACFPANQLERAARSDREKGRRSPSFSYVAIYGSNFFSTAILFSISLLGLLLQISQFIKWIWWRQLSSHSQHKNKMFETMQWRENWKLRQISIKSLSLCLIIFIKCISGDHMQWLIEEPTLYYLK